MVREASTLAESAPCARVMALIGSHWMTEAALVHAAGTSAESVRRCLAEAMADGTLETPRGVYRNTMWRRPGHHSS